MSSLELLPQNLNHFTKKSYWDDFFVKWKRKNENGSSFEWYGSWKDINALVMSQLRKRKSDCKVLNIGCGNSTLGLDMYNDGFESVLNIDFSEVVIREMQVKHSEFQGLQYEVMDVLNMKAEWSDSFDIVIDKGTLDALVHDDAKDNVVRQLFSEITRVLAKSGLYLCVSLAQQHILESLIDTFSASKGFLMKIFAFEPADDSSMIPFLFCIEKSSKVPQIELHMQPGEVLHSHGLDAITKEMNDRRMVYQMNRSMKTLGHGLRGKFALWGAKSEDKYPRYSISVMDSGVPKQEQNCSCGVLIVPQGRETEWNFSSEEGILNIANGNKIGRLIVVSMGRNHSFESMVKVQAELSPAVLPLAPINQKDKIPFMTVSSNLGSRKIVAEANSELSGPCVVEDVKVDTDDGKQVSHRRLVFMNNCDAIQSEARLMPNKPASNTKKKNKKKQQKKLGPNDFVVDRSYLAFEFHRAMVAGWLMYCSGKMIEESNRILLIGLGGGGLASFLATELSQILNSEPLHVDVVELDPTVAEIATKWFGFEHEGEANINVHIGDGIDFVGKCSSKNYCSLFIDVDAKDLTQPVLFPPASFIEEGFLHHIRDQVLTPDGILVLNLASRSKDMQSQILARIGSIFAHVYMIPLQELGDINAIVICFGAKASVSQDKEDLKKAQIYATSRLEKYGNKAMFQEWVDECVSVQQLI